VAIFIEKLLRGEEPVINGDGKQTRDYVFIRDIVRGNLAALESSYRGAINLGTGIETEVNEIFQTLLRVGNFSAPERHGPAKAGEQRRSVIDNSLAGRVLGWQPSVTLAEGLRETVDFFRARSA
jgi:UDP-glucose 4-epimerase